MTLKTFLRAGSVSAVAVALAIGALPASAQDGHRGRGRENRSGDQVQQQRPERVQSDEARPQRAERQQRAQAAPQQRTYQAPVAQERGAQGWNRGERRSDTGAERQGGQWNRRDNTSNDWAQARAARAQAQQQAQAQAQAQATARTRSQDWSGRRQGGIEGRSNTGGWERNRTYSDAARNQTYRNGYRDGQRNDSWQDRQQQQNAYRSGYRDGTRTDSYRDGLRRYGGDYRRWNNNDWRRDNRYNWYSYRNSNRNVYRLGRYYSPYSNYRYNRLSIGFQLGSLFYGSRYWINDPWQYRLPAAYGPYRWIRYYDDALLVDIYTGEVVDVVYDFFW